MAKKNMYKNILVIVIGLLCIDYIFKIQYLAFIAFSIGLVSILIPAMAFGVDWLWAKIGFILGWVNSKILLTLLYFLMLLPIALLRRVFGSSVLQLNNSQELKSLYNNRNHLYKKEDLIDTW